MSTHNLCFEQEYEKYQNFLSENFPCSVVKFSIYSRLSLSLHRLSRITAYVQVKIWSLFKHKNLTTGNKILWKRGEIAPLFHNIFIIHNNVYICEMWLFDLFFLSSANLICRCTDISKYFRQSPPPWNSR